jgi:hypothetical protein
MEVICKGVAGQFISGLPGSFFPGVVGPLHKVVEFTFLIIEVDSDNGLHFVVIGVAGGGRSSEGYVIVVGGEGKELLARSSTCLS